MGESLALTSKGWTVHRLGDISLRLFESLSIMHSSPSTDAASAKRTAVTVCQSDSPHVAMDITTHIDGSRACAASSLSDHGDIARFFSMQDVSEGVIAEGWRSGLCERLPEA